MTISHHNSVNYWLLHQDNLESAQSVASHQALIQPEYLAMTDQEQNLLRLNSPLAPSVYCPFRQQGVPLRKSTLLVEDLAAL